MKNNYLIYYNDFFDIKIICYLIRFYLKHNKKYKKILKSMYKKYYNLIKNDTIKIIINNTDYIIFEYDKNNINYNILNKHSIDSDEFNNQIINNTIKLVVFINNNYLINNV